MTDISLNPREAAAKAPSNSIFRHARYVVAENPVTGLAFGLFILIALCALIGPFIVPHDPLASDTSATLAAPSVKHWFGTDQLGRDIFSRVIVATRLDFTIAITSVVLVFAMGGFAGIAAGFFGGWTDRIRRAYLRYHYGFPVVRSRNGHRRSARQYGDQHRACHRHYQFSALCARCARRGKRETRRRFRAGGAAVRQRRFPHSVDAHPA